MNKGDLNAQEVHTLGRAGAFIATKRLNKKSRTDFLLWINRCRQSLKILGIVS